MGTHDHDLDDPCGSKHKALSGYAGSETGIDNHPGRSGAGWLEANEAIERFWNHFPGLRERYRGEVAVREWDYGRLVTIHAEPAPPTDWVTYSCNRHWADVGAPPDDFAGWDGAAIARLTAKYIVYYDRPAGTYDTRCPLCGQAAVTSSRWK